MSPGTESEVARRSSRRSPSVGGPPTLSEAGMADHTMELLFLGWIYGVIGCRVAIGCGHFTLPRLAFAALIWPIRAWLALCERADQTNLPGEGP